VHCFDTLRFILNDEVARVSTIASRDEHSGPFECAAEVSLEFEKGATGTVSVSTRAAYRTSLTIRGSKGSLSAPGIFSLDAPASLQLSLEGQPTESIEVSNELAFARQFDAFADAVEGKAAFCCPGEEGLRNQLVLDAVYRSMRSWCVERV
jgi:predicted dehydrogenase